jgi:hypothetical protein
MHNVDWEKLWVHRKMQQPGDEPGAMTLFKVANNKEHLTFLKHLSNEQLVEENGESKWLTVSNNVHYLDALCLAALAARKLGVQSIAQKHAPKTQEAAYENEPEVEREGTSRIRMRY